MQYEQQDENNPTLGYVLFQLVEELGLSSLNQLWDKAGMTSNRSAWYKRLDPKNKKQVTEPQLRELLRGLEVEGGYTITAEQKAKLYGAIHISVIEESTSSNRDGLMKALYDPDRQLLLEKSLKNFIPGTRQTEMSALLRAIVSLSGSGGYLTIAGKAGEGKTTLIAQLINSSQYGRQQTPYHFIPFNPGLDHQVTLLRSLMACLTLKYSYLRSDFWTASFHRETLASSFSRMLQDISMHGDRETIFIDGLDQIKPDAPMEERDLSFLPPALPQGVVIILGTRPDDTLKPLHLLSMLYEYELPKLSRSDFDRMFAHYKVFLSEKTIEQLYRATQQNALYMHLVVKMVAETKATRPEDVIRRMSENPENIFSLSLNRFKRPKQEWREVIKPTLGLLLVVQEPLRLTSMSQILKIDHEALKDGLRQLGGLVAEEQGKYYLYHLKLRDYLREEQNNPTKDFVITTQEESDWHMRVAEWCERNGESSFALLGKIAQNPAEQERRIYACQYYITHLYHAHAWQRLFVVLDAGVYGQVKMQHDPSARSYIRDLDLGRQAAIQAASHEETLGRAVTFLPYLWRYTLLRCTLTSHADQYPLEAFRLLVLLKQKNEALQLAEILTNPAFKIHALVEIARQMEKDSEQNEEHREILIRACDFANVAIKEVTYQDWPNQLIDALLQAQLWEQAEQIINMFPVLSLEQEDRHNHNVCKLAKALAQNQQWNRTEEVIDSIPRSSLGIYKYNEALQKLGEELARHHLWERAETVIRTIESDFGYVRGLYKLGEIRAQAQQWEHAEAVWREAEQKIDTIQGEQGQNILFCELGKTVANAQRWEQAERIWEKAEHAIGNLQKDDPDDPDEGDLRPQEFSRLASALIDVRQWKHAEAVVRSIQDCGWYITTACELGKALIQTEQWERMEAFGRETEHKLQTFIFQQDDLSVRTVAWKLRDLSEILAQMYQWEQAKAVMHLIQKNDEYIQALAKLWEILIQTGQREQAEAIWEEAESAITALPKAQEQIPLLCELGETLVRAQRGEQAEKFWEKVEALIDTLRENYMSAEAFSKVVEMLIQAQQWERAERVIGSVQMWQEECQSNSGRMLIQAQQWERAERVISSILGGNKRSEILCELAEALIQAQQWEQAKKVWQKARYTINTIDDLAQRGEAFVEQGKILIQLGLWEQAEQIITGLQPSYRQATAFVQLGEALVQAGQTEQAEHIWLEAENVIDTIQEEIRGTGGAQILGEAILLAQHWRRAEQMLSIILIGKERSEALSRLGQIIVQAQQWERAENIIRAIDDTDEQSKALDAFIEKITQAQEWEQAERVISTVQDSLVRSKALSKLGKALTAANQQERAERVWMQSKQVISSMQNCLIQIKAIHDLAEAFEYTQQRKQLEDLWEQAKHFIDTVEAGRYKDVNLHELGKVLVQMQEWEQAEQVCNAIEEDWRRGQALCEIAKALARTQEWGRAESILLKAIHQINMVELHEQVRNRMIGEQATVFMQIQQWEQAKTLINTLSHYWDRDVALRELVNVLAQARQWEQTKEFIESIHQDDQRILALCNLVEALAQEQQWERAKEILQEAEHKSSALSGKRREVRGLEVTQALIHGCISVQQWEEAERLISTLDRSYEQATPLHELGKALIRAQQWERAERIIMTIPSSINQSVAVRELGEALIHAQQWEWAERVIRTLQSRDWQTKELLALGKALAEANRDNDALLHLVQRAWLQVEERDDAITLLSMATTLIPLQPTISEAFCSAFMWVDRFYSK